MFEMDMTENDAQFRARHNQRLFEKQREEEKKREQEIAKRRAEWNSTPESKRICYVCSLKLDAVTVGKITENPTLPRHHEICNPFSVESHVVQGLVSLLKESYGDDPIPLATLQQLIDVWRKQSGVCAISKAKLYFPIEATETKTPEYASSLVARTDQWSLRRQYEAEQVKLKRLAEIHSPVLDFSEDGTLRLLSRTVARWREGLTPGEFTEIVRALNTELNPAFPESRSFNRVSTGYLNPRFIR